MFAVFRHARLLLKIIFVAVGLTLLVTSPAPIIYELRKWRGRSQSLETASFLSSTDRFVAGGRLYDIARESASPTNIVSQLLLRLHDVKVDLSEETRGLGVTDVMRKRSIVNQGNTERLENILFEVLRTNRTLNIGALGGSITKGFRLSNPNETYARIFGRRLQKILRVPVKVYVGAENSRGSYYFQYCVQDYLPLEKLDLILGDFAANDGFGRVSAVFQEILLRRLMTLKRRPQIFYVNFLLGPFLKLGSCENSEDDEITPLSEHYCIPSLSFRSALCTHRRRQIDFFYADDGVHPNKISHKLMSNLLLEFTVDLLLKYYEKGDMILHANSINHNATDANESTQLPRGLWTSSNAGYRNRCLVNSPTSANRLVPVEKGPSWRPWPHGYKSERANTSITFKVASADLSETCDMVLCVTPCVQCGNCGVEVTERGQFIASTVIGMYSATPVAYNWVTIASKLQPGTYSVKFKNLENKLTKLSTIAMICT